MIPFVQTNDPLGYIDMRPEPEPSIRRSLSPEQRQRAAQLRQELLKIQKEIDGQPEKAFWKSEQDFMQNYNHRKSQLHHELTSVCDETNEICSGIIARFISLVEKVVEKFTGEDLSLCEIWGVPACLS